MDGIINVYKERGYTSHDVVAKLRGIFHQKKIGHTGTLDPDAEGVLPVCLGKGTKVCELLTDWDKEYCTTLLLGLTTDTQDMTGTVLKQCPVFLYGAESFSLSEEHIRRCIDSFVGESEQVPPMYSALKVNGKKLYELARQGIEVERRPRRICIHEIRVEKIEEKVISRSAIPDPGFPVIAVQLTVKCSKGTYIRTLCSDIGEKLGCGGCMLSLIRTEVGPFHITDSFRLFQIEELRNEDRLDECLCPVDSVFANLDAVQLTAEAERLVRNGNPLSCEMLSCCFDSGGKRLTGVLPKTKKQLRIYGQNMEFLAVYEYSEEKQNWRARKMFLS